RFIFDGEITVFSANPSAELDYHYQSNQTTVLLNVKLGHSLDSVFFEQGLLISFIGAGQLIQVEAATNRGFKIVTRIDIASDIADNKPENLPGDFILHQNFPNPFNNRTMINFDLPLASDVKFEILNLLGQTVYRMEKRYSAGSYSIGWDGIDNAGRTVGSGVYYYRIVAGEFVESKKMILLK
ncbi:MAG: T9SS type A sorting domain-containing protein, partial [Nitrososphaerales archaeon]